MMPLIPLILRERTKVRLYGSPKIINKDYFNVAGWESWIFIRDNH